MFNKLSDSLTSTFARLRGKGIITETDLNDALREVRVALLEADVALPVAKDLIARIKEKALGEEIIRSVSPAQMVIKIVQDELTAILKSDNQALNLNATPPVVFLMCGIQGSGKTTSSGKLAARLKNKQNKKILLASVDVARPAAQEQLATLGKQASVDTLPIIAGQQPLDITKRAMTEAKLGGYDILIIDTAGRLHTDADLMEELRGIKRLSNPTEILLVADSLTGQDAVNLAQEFNNAVGITGLILTRVDGDGRGGAALSMRAITGQPIKFIGVGEKLDQLEEFHAERIASRILGMGDVVSLVEKALENVDQEQAEKMAKRLKKGQFDFNDLADQIGQMKKMGGMSSMLNMLPGMGAMKQKIAEANVDEKIFDRQLAIIRSMTKKERTDPKMLNASRKRRIAAGSGTQVPEINKLVKMQMEMHNMMKKFGGMDKKSLLRNFKPF
jgi:signal recognition particle subunit SRP54